MPDLDRLQYNSIGTAYEAIKLIPGSLLERHAVRHAVLPYIRNARVLDLACGTGYYSRLLLEWGARSVLAVDISESMIQGAKQVSRGVGSESDGAEGKDWMDQGRLEFRVGDCMIPTMFSSSTNEEEGQYDVVTGFWLLNYASSSTDLTKFLTTISLNLKPGGTFLGVVPNILATDPANKIEFDTVYTIINEETSDTATRKYGVVTTVNHELSNGQGWFMHVKAYLKPQTVEFDNYSLKKSIYDECIAQIGLKGVKWIRPRTPKRSDRKDEWEEGIVRDGFERIQKEEEEGYWDLIDRAGLLMLLVAHKP